MRLGIVRGHVTLSPAVPELLGKTLVVLEPVTMANLVAKNGIGRREVAGCRRRTGRGEGSDGGLHRRRGSSEPLLACTSSDRRVLCVDCRFNHDR